MPDPRPVLLTPALEDYLETIYELVRDRKVARVRDIAQARGVKASSVTPALKRLAEMDLVNYEQREYIELTPSGESRARRILARHQILVSFLQEVLHLPAEEAHENACAMEHQLSDEAMDRFVRFFEFVRSSPDGTPHFLRRFHDSLGLGPDAVHSEHCLGHGMEVTPHATLADLRPGERARVVHVDAEGPIRKRLIDMGVRPDVDIHVERTAPAGDPVWIRIGGFQLSLRKNEAEAIHVRSPRS